MFRWVTDENIDHNINISPDQPLRLSLTLQNIFPSGMFRVQIGVKKADRTEEYLISDDAIYFEAISTSQLSAANGMYWSPNSKYTVDSGRG